MAEHGGLLSFSREGSLETALARPQNIYHCSAEPPPLERLAAAYGFAIAKGHCFPDGSKRPSLAVMDIFLQLNGREMTADEAGAVIVVRAVAAGKMDEEGLVAWIAGNSGPLVE